MKNIITSKFSTFLASNNISALVTALLLLLPFISNSQSKGILWQQTMKNNNAPVKRISEYQYEMPLKDSAQINGFFEENLPLSSMEFYNSENNITRQIGYQNGEIKFARDFIYENGRLTESIADTLYSKDIRRTRYEALPSNSTKIIEITENSKNSYWIIQEDEKGQTLGEYFIKNGKDTSSFVQYSYNAYGECISMSTQYHKGEKRYTSLSIYDNNRKKIKYVTYDIAGNLSKEENYSYPKENVCQTKHTNYETGVVTYSTDVYFKDKYGNEIKRYYNSQYTPDRWTVLLYKIEYATEKE